MKKTLLKSVSLMLCAAIVFTFASCGKGEEVSTGTIENTLTATVPEITGEEPQTVTSEVVEDKTATTAAPYKMPKTETTTAENVPDVQSVSGSLSSVYSPVYGISIGSEKVRKSVSIDSFVPSNLQEAYYQCRDGVKALQSSIPLSTPISSDNLNRVIIYLRDLNPDLFYVDWTSYGFITSGGRVVSLNMKYTFASPQTQIDELESAVSQIVAKANTLSNAFERELYVHDYLVNNVIYSTSTANSGTAYGALIEGYARCEGYARAFEMIMNRLGITTVVVSGYSENQRHMWNAVELYGNYYYVDVTFDDNASENYKTSYGEDEISHSCFNVPEEVLTKTHNISASGSSDQYGSYQNLVYPTCNSYDYNYYKVRGLFITSLDEFKYVLSQSRNKKIANVFYYGTMPSVAEFQSAFDDFFRVYYPLKGYSIQFNPENSSIYKRNVFEISWKVN